MLTPLVILRTCDLPGRGRQPQSRGAILAVLFGDGAAGVVLEATSVTDAGFDGGLSYRSGPDGSQAGAWDDYFLAATRFFFFAGSFGRDLPNEPW